MRCLTRRSLTAHSVLTGRAKRPRSEPRAGRLWKLCGRLCGGFKQVLFSIIYGIIHQPLTNSYFSRWLLHHQPVRDCHLPGNPMASLFINQYNGLKVWNMLTRSRYRGISVSPVYNGVYVVLPHLVSGMHIQEDAGLLR